MTGPCVPSKKHFIKDLVGIQLNPNRNNVNEIRIAKGLPTERIDLQERALRLGKRHAMILQQEPEISYERS